ncbi:DHA2 family efflux MFS transporter permease subunit [Ramlibacter sp. GTP1]|uniref:DHA2 family efflux MFS transporter permease subunit n=2 Tax=Ramlibacter albus TaxID=2079448 RepID=A0A923M5A9_9BURK|nr:DHA2 family efflux MFS transporter permease subunit [Ramlibacter albus]
MIGTIVSVLSSTIVNVALPDIMGAFGMGQDKAQLLSTAFLAAMTGAMLLNAWMVESFGQRATFLLAISVFMGASVLGGLAPAEGVLILARILQGASAGILQPLTMMVIFQVFPPERRGSAMGIYGIGVVLAPALGPAVGGIMVDSFSWRYVFFLTPPFCAIGILAALMFLPGRAGSGPPRRFDWIGFLLMAVFLVTLLTGLSHGQRDGWSSNVIVLNLAAAAACGMAFFWWELRTASPMLNLKLFSIPAFSAASVVAFIFGAGIYGSTYLVPLFVQTVQGYTATRSGLLLMPAGLVLGVIFPLAGRLTDRTSPHMPIVLGLIVFATSSALMAQADTNTSFLAFAWWLVLGRIGLAFIMTSLNAGALGTVPHAMLGQGSGAINFVRQLGGALGVNLLSVALERRSQLYTQTFAATQDAANTASAEALRQLSALYAHAGLTEGVALAASSQFLGSVVAAQGSMMAFRDSFRMVSVIFMIGVIPAVFIHRQAAERGSQGSPTGRGDGCA